MPRTRGSVRRWMPGRDGRTSRSRPWRSGCPKLNVIDVSHCVDKKAPPIPLDLAADHHGTLGFRASIADCRRSILVSAVAALAV